LYPSAGDSAISVLSRVKQLVVMQALALRRGIDQHQISSVGLLWVAFQCPANLDRQRSLVQRALTGNLVNESIGRFAEPRTAVRHIFVLPVGLPYQQSGLAVDYACTPCLAISCKRAQTFVSSPCEVVVEQVTASGENTADFDLIQMGHG